ncbi:MCP domain signal transducer [Halorhabdus tiamatea SARL4B]|uniref:histidine kinase n=1 Tax=Halorhabdus tiamatea SARL4B TaxID=1033806 RepID=S6D3L3_9EURY|nr:MCP domain signal transducer [Halorhabdus tiamatea SARL4B]
MATAVPDVIRKRFALKFALVLAIMGLLLAGIGFTATGTLSEQVEDNVNQEYEELANRQATIVEEWVKRNTVSVQLASQNSGLREDPQQAELTLNQQSAPLTGSAESMHLVSFAGDQPQVIARSTGMAATDLPISLSETPQSWILDTDIQNADAESVSMSDVYRKDGDTIIGFASRVKNSGNRFLVVEYFVDEVGESIENSPRTNHFAQAINTDGTVQIDSRMTGENADDSRVGSEYGNSETVALAFEQATGDDDRRSGVRIIENNPSVIDEEYAVGYASIEVRGVETQWAIVTHAPTSDLFALVNSVTTGGQLVVGVGVLLIVLVGASLGYSTASALDRLRAKVEEMEAGNLDVPIHSTRIDSIGRLYDGFANMRDSLREQISEAEQARKEAEVSRAEAMEMSEYLQEKAEEYSQTMERCAAGDLTRRMDIDGENEAMDRIASEFNEMIDELEKTTGQLKSFADEVEESSEIVLNSADSVQEASEQVADSVQRISDDAYEQQERLQDISEEIDAISARLDDFAAEHPDIDFEDQLAQIDEVARTVAAVVDLAEETLEESESVAGAAEEQAAELNEVSQRADDLIRYAGPLHDVLDRFETQSEHEFYFPTGPRDEEENGE